MRILQVTDFFPPVRGGLETHVDDLAAELADRGHEVHVATLTADPDPAHPAVQAHIIRSTLSSVANFDRADRPFAPPIPDPGARRGLAQLVRDIEPDVVHAHSWLAASLPRRRRPPTVFTAHDYALVCQLHTLLRTDGSRCAGPALATCIACGGRRYGVARSAALAGGTVVGRHLLSVDRVLTLSERVRGVVAPRLGVPTEVVTGFVRADAAEETPAGLPVEPYVMYAGDPGDHKGLSDLLAVWAGSAPTTPLVVASTKELSAAVPDNVTVLQLDRAQVRGAWRRAVLAVVPSRWDEPFGMVVLEALSAGVPVVATRVGALPELVRDGVDGVLVPPNDVAALGAGINALLGDAVGRAAMTTAAASASQRFTAAAVVPRVEAAYRRVVADARRTA